MRFSFPTTDFTDRGLHYKVERLTHSPKRIARSEWFEVEFRGQQGWYCYINAIFDDTKEEQIDDTHYVVFNGRRSVYNYGDETIHLAPVKTLRRNGQPIVPPANLQAAIEKNYQEALDR